MKHAAQKPWVGRSVLVLCATAAGACFLADLLVPNTVAIGLLYSFVVLGAGWSRDPRSIVAFAGIATLLILLGWLLEPATTQVSLVGGINRALAILLVWTIAATNVGWLGTERRLDAGQALLRTAHRRQSEFLATLSHELRNPLSPLSTAVEILRMGQPDPELVADSCRVMRRQIQHLTRLLDDLLDASRLEHGRIHLRKARIELSRLLTEASDATGHLVEQAGHTLSVSLPAEPVYLDADPVRLVQVFGNLLSNAAKYTPEGGHIQLAAARLDGGVQIRVRDDGIGIEPERIAEIFEMFQQLDRSLETGFSGLGIGLTLVKALVDLHGGRIEVHSEGRGKGTEFRVWLPVLPPSDAPPPDPLAEDPATTDFGVRHRILVVEDNPDSAYTLARLLELLGHEVHVAHDGLAAMEVAAEIHPHVILLDLGLPKLNGYEVARRIRGRRWGRPILIAALTGWGQQSDRLRTSEAGFDAHLTKPAEPAALQSVLTRVAAHEPVPDSPARFQFRDPRPRSPEPASTETNGSSAPPPQLRRIVHDLRGALNALVLQLLVLTQRTTDRADLRELVDEALLCSQELTGHIERLTPEPKP